MEARRTGGGRRRGEEKRTLVPLMDDGVENGRRQMDRRLGHNHNVVDIHESVDQLIRLKGPDFTVGKERRRR